MKRSQKTRTPRINCSQYWRMCWASRSAILFLHPKPKRNRQQKRRPSRASVLFLELNVVSRRDLDNASRLVRDLCRVSRISEDHRLVRLKLVLGNASITAHTRIDLSTRTHIRHSERTEPRAGEYVECISLRISERRRVNESFAVRLSDTEPGERPVYVEIHDPHRNAECVFDRDQSLALA